MRAVQILGVVAILSSSSCPAAVSASEFRVPGHGMLNVRVKSLVELRFKSIVRQTHDVSCGAAALATLLTYYFGTSVGEKEIIDRVLEDASEDTRLKVLADGFSMLELKRTGEQLGFVGAGFRIPAVENLARLRVPALTLVNVRGYSHFVVIKGVANGQVFIADPAFGNRSRTLSAFEKEWHGVVLVFQGEHGRADSSFKLDPTLLAPGAQVLSILDSGLRRIGPPRAGEF